MVGFGIGISIGGGEFVGAEVGTGEMVGTAVGHSTCVGRAAVTLAGRGVAEADSEARAFAEVQRRRVKIIQTVFKQGSSKTRTSHSGGFS